MAVGVWVLGTGSGVLLDAGRTEAKKTELRSMLDEMHARDFDGW